MLAVNCPAHVPAAGHATCSSSRTADSSSFPMVNSPSDSQMSWMLTSRPRQCPGAIEPEYSSTVGRSMRHAAMSPAGTVLSQPTSSTSPSK